MVGATGFEPTTSSTPRSNGAKTLRLAPKNQGETGVLLTLRKDYKMFPLLYHYKGFLGIQQGTRLNNKITRNGANNYDYQNDNYT